MAKQKPATFQPKKDPSQHSAAYDKMAPRIDLVNVLMEGTDALRAAGETYLPRYTNESQTNYQVRLERSILLNYFRRSVLSLCGKPFSSPVQLGDMPEALLQLSENIDRQGNNIDVFARKSFQDGLTKGITHILVEFPGISPDVTTLEQERKVGAAPYFVFVAPESIIAAYCEYQNGQEILTHVRIYETETKRDGFDEIFIERIRVLEPGAWKLYKKDGKKWDLESEGITTLDYIPLVTFYADREEFMVARPPLLDLAHVNIAHYQSASDQRNVLTVARFPMLAASGVNDEEANIQIGPKQLLQATSKDGKFYYVEHSGASIEAGRKDLEDMKAEMSILGIELLSKSGNATATAKAIDTAENLSMIQAMVIVYQDFLERCYQIAAEWLGIPDSGGTVKLNTDFALSNSTADVSALQFARQNGEISHEAYITELQRRGILNPDFNEEDDKVLLDSEKTQAMADEVLNATLMAEVNPTPPVQGA